MMLASVWGDLRSTLRGWRTRLVVYGVAAASLALAWGTTAAALAVVGALYTRALPFDAPERLVFLDGASRREGQFNVAVSIPDLQDWRQRARTFESMAGFQTRPATNLVVNDVALRVQPVMTSPDFLAVLGVKPEIGRPFGPQDATAGAAKTALVAFPLAERLFSTAHTALGKSLWIDQAAYEIVGVLPRDFFFPTTRAIDVPDVLLPLALDGSQSQNRRRRTVRVVGKLAAGVALADAQRELDAIAETLRPLYPPSRSIPGAFDGVTLTPFRDRLVRGSGKSAAILGAAAGLVLIVALINVGALLVPRWIERLPELHLRRALGASGAQIWRLLFMESALISAVGAVGGYILARWTLGAFLSALPSEFQLWRTVVVDTWVLLRLLLAAVIASLLVTWLTSLLLPGVRNGWPDRRLTASRSVVRTMRGASVLQVAAILTLLVASVALSESVWHAHTSSGIEAARGNLMMMRISFDQGRYAQASDRLRTVSSLLDALRGLPGVAASGATDRALLAGHIAGSGFHLDGGGTSGTVVSQVGITSGFLEAIGLQAVRGEHSITPGKRGDLLINETFARSRWGRLDVVGETLTNEALSPPMWRVAGVVPDSKTSTLDDNAPPEIYVPLEANVPLSVDIVVRAVDGAELSFEELHRVMSKVAPALPAEIYDYVDAERASLSDRWARTVLAAAVASIGLVLTVIGLYAALSYRANLRQRDLGIRLALGAEPNGVRRLMLNEGLATLGMGLALGMVSTALASRYGSAVLYDVGPADIALATIGCALFLLTFLTVVGVLRPAAAAARVDPASLLRQP